MLLTELLQIIVREKESPVVRGTLDNWYLPAIADYRHVLNRQPEIKDLTRGSINDWIDCRVQSDVLARATIKTRRGAILAIWRAANEMGIVAELPEKIRKIKLIRKNPVAWRRDEIQRLVDYTMREMPNRRLPVVKLDSRLYFGALICAGYDTALRLGDLLSLERGWIQVDKEGAGWLKIAQSKTGNFVSCRINPVTMQLIDRLMEGSARRLVWPLWCRRESFYARFKRIVKASNIRPGTFRYLRRASATHVEHEHPGTSHLHTGHTDPGTTQRYYLDSDQLQSFAVSPMPLEICT